jgi:hypothetical protein
MPRRLCIVSGDLLRCDAFIPALASLSRDDELEIIADRRRGVAPSEAVNRPAEERRFRPYLDLALKVDGFAFVPWSPTPVATAPTPAPGSNVAPTPQRFPPASSLERLVIDDEDEADRERLERILRFKPRRRVGPLVLMVFASAIVVAAFATMPALRSGVSPVVPDAPRPVNQPKRAGQADETVVATQTLPPVPQAPATESPEPAASPTTGATHVEPAPGREPLAPPALPEPIPRAPRPRSASPTPKVVAPPSATPRAAPLPNGTPRVVPPPITSASVAAPGPEMREMSPSLPGVPRVELTRAGARSPESAGDTYTVRVADINGRPLAGADILLLARMADGTAASIPLSSGAEPGTYQGTMPPGRSSLVDLRVRVTTSDRRVEIPFAP